MSSHVAWWEHHLLNDDEFGHIRFKTLSSGTYLPFRTARVGVDQVSQLEFLTEESDRLPFVLGTQFGFFPRLNEVEGFYLDPRIVALLSKSALSGSISSLTICLIPNHFEPWKIIRDFPEQCEIGEAMVRKEIRPQIDYGCVLRTGERLSVI